MPARVLVPVALFVVAVILGSAVFVYKSGQYFRGELNTNFSFTPLNDVELMANLRGKRAVVVTGTTNSIGGAVAKALAQYGVSVFVITPTDAEELLEDMRQRSPQIAEAQFSAVYANLSSMGEAAEAARKIAQSIPDLDILVFSVGTLAKTTRSETPDGLERDFAQTFMCRFVILRILLPLLRRSEGMARVINIASSGLRGTINFDDLQSQHAYDPWAAHSNSNTANDLLVRYLARKETNLDAFGLNPGFIKTDIHDNVFLPSTVGKPLEWLISRFYPSYDEYAMGAVLQIIASKELDHKSGLLFNPWGEVVNYVGDAAKDDYSKRLWQEASKLMAKLVPKKCLNKFDNTCDPKIVNAPALS